MNKYIQKIEKLIKKKMSETEAKETTVKEKVVKGFMSRKETSTKEKEVPKDAMETIADQIIFIRNKRMELKNDNAN